jgi:hypothetical protein
VDRLALVRRVCTTKSLNSLIRGWAEHPSKTRRPANERCTSTLELAISADPYLDLYSCCYGLEVRACVANTWEIQNRYFISTDCERDDRQCVAVSPASGDSSDLTVLVRPRGARLLRADQLGRTCIFQMPGSSVSHLWSSSHDQTKQGCRQLFHPHRKCP